MLAQTALSCKPQWLSYCPCLDSPILCYPFVEMQDDITRDEVIEAAVAFAAPLLVQFLCAFSADKGKRIQPPRPDWVQLSCSVIFGIIGSALAVTFGIARAGHLLYTRELFLAWKGVSLLASRIFEVTALVYPLFRRMRTPFPRLVPVLFIFEVLCTSTLVGTGIWQLKEYGPEFLWIEPIILKTAVTIIAISSIIQIQTKGKVRWEDRRRLGFWVIINLQAVIVGIVSAALRQEWAHLAQCLSCVAVVLEYIVWKRWRERWREGWRERWNPVGGSTTTTANDTALIDTRKYGDNMNSVKPEHLAALSGKRSLSESHQRWDSCGAHGEHGAMLVEPRRPTKAVIRPHRL
ncbi:hypothetical protein B0T24DRAFT_629789 [Lasiosphaeria ovina]|uniref:Uncharacterized protein n=1 Tax=Lasiosphaeria ovina TaxID=92902 RepID=A0AAE0K8R4_9PEZI|nr:hypothetical protein B0T24DRAFT_629789 [Lasiosphaeria ovina]